MIKLEMSSRFASRMNGMDSMNLGLRGRRLIVSVGNKFASFLEL